MVAVRHAIHRAAGVTCGGDVVARVADVQIAGERLPHGGAGMDERCGVGFALRRRVAAHHDREKSGQIEFFQQLMGERFGFVGDDGQRRTQCTPGVQRGADAGVDAAMLAVGVRVMPAKNRNGVRQLLGSGWGRKSQAALH